MIVENLFDEEMIAKYTHVASIGYADLAALANGNTGSFNIASLVSGDVFGNVSTYLATPFVFSDGTLISSAITVGDTGSATTDLASTELNAAGTFITTKAGTSWIAQNAALTKTVFFTGTGSKNLNTATAGQLIVLFTKVQLKPYSRL